MTKLAETIRMRRKIRQRATNIARQVALTIPQEFIIKIAAEYIALRVCDQLAWETRGPSGWADPAKLADVDNDTKVRLTMETIIDRLQNQNP